MIGVLSNMNVRRLAGATLIALPFVMVIALMIYWSGWWVAVGIVCGTAALIGIVYVGMMLLDPSYEPTTDAPPPERRRNQDNGPC